MVLEEVDQNRQEQPDKETLKSDQKTFSLESIL